ncbi:hypothetical protein KDL01_40055 [Actinospica durhamensis]|uniref:Uncharacterized protein n=1 Tax=Actinospica durhamensis TaxID=1508375 RepID=A0A941IVK0_9ACTN|nr:hypothetical protein [Actinospica durhamensis]MBR7839518.1 hypothetical protein [Actinospica durhamensis]
MTFALLDRVEQKKSSHDGGVPDTVVAVVDVLRHCCEEGGPCSPELGLRRRHLEPVGSCSSHRGIARVIGHFPEPVDQRCAKRSGRSAAPILADCLGPRIGENGRKRGRIPPMRCDVCEHEMAKWDVSSGG